MHQEASHKRCKHMLLMVSHFRSDLNPCHLKTLDEEENEREHPIGCITGIGRAIEIRLDL